MDSHWHYHFGDANRGVVVVARNLARSHRILVEEFENESWEACLGADVVMPPEPLLLVLVFWMVLLDSFDTWDC